MTEIVGVRFKKAGKIYYFAPGDKRIETDTPVIVETARGVEYGIVVIGNRQIASENVTQPLKKIMRVATKEDEAVNEQNKKREAEAFDIGIEKIRNHGLEMKLVGVELTFDRSKLIFYFTAPGRIDFRELVKELASIFRTRIELRQIGVRDESKLLNGIGICGRALCCATYLSEFQPVSIKMAKEQNLSLNPTKISGICGRLMCCLKYEEETYEYLNSKLPHVGNRVRTVDGDGEVLDVSVIRQLVKVEMRKNPKDVPIVNYYAVDEVEILQRTTKHKPKLTAALDAPIDDSLLKD